MLFEEKGRCIRSALFVSMGMKKGPSERAVLDGTGCGGAVPSSRGGKEVPQHAAGQENMEEV
ncbi:hypothetical protein DESPIG_01453 [Desulfovibrio piger ATCC 29098]|uniref:Uncharacterized protein n=1 Tax=Desulfovibrio piger ATCC 29098 TaxID=411464 RepID=B6WTP7_9BACT|nr:hypothetical protein DESPIG_01453 [Desulfovibrio piger ATCC 29098]